MKKKEKLGRQGQTLESCPALYEERIEEVKTDRNEPKNPGVRSVLREAGKETGVLYYPIGGTVFKVRVHLSEEAAETMEDRIIRLMKSEGPILGNSNSGIVRRENVGTITPDLKIRDFIIFLSRDPEICVMIEAPRTDRLPEGSASCA